jgi:hypothetical protein
MESAILGDMLTKAEARLAFLQSISSTPERMEAVRQLEAYKKYQTARLNYLGSLQSLDSYEMMPLKQLELAVELVHDYRRKFDACRMSLCLSRDWVMLSVWEQDALLKE